MCQSRKFNFHFSVIFLLFKEQIKMLKTYIDEVNYLEDIFFSGDINQFRFTVVFLSCNRVSFVQFILVIKLYSHV